MSMEIGSRLPRLTIDWRSILSGSAAFLPGRRLWNLGIVELGANSTAPGMIATARACAAARQETGSAATLFGGRVGRMKRFRSVQGAGSG